MYLLEMDLQEVDALSWTTDPTLYTATSDSNQCSSTQIAESDVSDLFSFNPNAFRGSRVSYRIFFSRGGTFVCGKVDQLRP